MKIKRRLFLRNLGLTLLGSQITAFSTGNHSSSPIKPARLKIGDTVGLISPASFSEPEDIQLVEKDLSQLGLKVKIGQHLFDRYGYLGGRDVDRAADVNAMFADPSVKAILPVWGGWGCNRILPLLDYDLIRKNPKILIGFSDITSLLLAIYARSGMVTFHGPVGMSSWNDFSVNYLRRVLFAGEAVVLRNPLQRSVRADKPQKLTHEMPVQTITPGKARGKLIGGNLSVLTAMLGSSYLPDFHQAILFVEEIGEEVYRIDRLLNQLKLAGILSQISGFIFGQCVKCDAEEPDKSLSLGEVLGDVIAPLGIPAWYGSAIGHIGNKFTLPVGVEAEIDADWGTIKLLEAAVS